MKIQHLVFLPVEKKGYRNSKHLVLKTLVIFAKKILKILFVIHSQQRMVPFLVIFLVRPKMVPYHLVLLQLTSDFGVTKKRLKSFKHNQKRIQILQEIIARRIQRTQLAHKLLFRNHKVE